MISLFSEFLTTTSFKVFMLTIVSFNV